MLPQIQFSDLWKIAIERKRQYDCDLARDGVEYSVTYQRLTSMPARRRAMEAIQL